MLNNADQTEKQTDKLLHKAIKLRADADAKTYDYNVRSADFDEIKGQSNE